MALQTTRPISLGDVRTELGLTGPISLGQAEVRALAGIPSGPISLGDLLGKSSVVSFVVGAKVVSGTTHRGYSSGEGMAEPYISVFGSISQQELLPAQSPYAPIVVQAITSQNNVSNVVNIMGTGTIQFIGNVAKLPEIRLNGGAWVGMTWDGKGTTYIQNATYRNLVYNNLGSTITIEARWP